MHKEERHPERGSAMLLVSVLLVALMAGGGIALFLQISGTKSIRLIKNAKTSLYCAEAGLARGHREVAINAGDVNDVLDGDGNGCPAWASTTAASHPHPNGGNQCIVHGDSNDDGTNDYYLTLVDDNDGDGDIGLDSNLRFYLRSECTGDSNATYTKTPRVLIELVSLVGIGHNYRDQSGGGAGNTGNMNTN